MLFKFILFIIIFNLGFLTGTLWTSICKIDDKEENDYRNN